MIIRLATLKDLKYIEHLSKIESHALGFIPNTAYEAAITGEKLGKRWSNGCNDKRWVCDSIQSSELVGFLLMVKSGEQRPAKPSDEHKWGFRIRLANKDIGLRELIEQFKECLYPHDQPVSGL